MVKNNLKSKRSQEEMVGFVLIVLMIVIILLIFLGFSIRNSEKEGVEDYEVKNFIQAFLHYTSDCRNNLKFRSILELISDCKNNEECQDKRDSCDVLEKTLKELIEESWKTGENLPVKGYFLNITLDNEELIPIIKKGNTSLEYKGASEGFNTGGRDMKIYFRVYYE